MVENKNRNDREYYRCLFENNHAVMLLIHPETGAIIDANLSACDFYGYSKEQLTNMKIMDINFLNDKEMENAKLENRKCFVFNHKLANGQIRIVEVYSGPLNINNQKLIYSIIHDITEKRKVEEAFKKSETEFQLQKSYFQELFKNSPEAIAILDNDDRIIDVNNGFEKLFQYSNIEIKNRFINDIIAPEKLYREAKKLSKRVTSGNVVKRESIRKKKDGTLIHVAILAYPIIHEEKQIGIYAIYTDITKNKRKEEKIKELAIKDSLTGLYNRYFFLEKLKKALSKAKRTKQNLAVMFIDVDGFKNINDNLGHKSGDEVLKIIANRIKKCIRKGDILARVGGDEFTVLLTNTKRYDEIVSTAKRIMNGFKHPMHIGESEIYMSISIGIVRYPLNGEDAETLIKNADIAMYKAKEYSSNRFEFYTSSLNKKLKEEFMIENGLRYALERNELVLYYQPIVNLETGEIAGAEALIRWEHPEYGKVSPDKFIPIAEKRGMIIAIGEWVLRTACFQNKKWQELGYTPIFIAVNISVRQLEQKGFVKFVEKTLKEIKLDPKYLELEITESISMKNIKDRIDILQDLKNLGIKLSLDDFGTGYSSLSQLKKLAISKLKIDRSFINDINIDQNYTAIVSTIIAIAKTLNLDVVAEGVETKEQLCFLANEKCHMVQGYLYSPPVPAEVFEKFLISRRII